MPTPAECFDQLGEAVKSERKRTAGLDATYQFVVEGPDGGEWWLRAASGTGEVGTGRVDDPNITITMSDDTFTKLYTGELEGQQAFFTGLLKAEGDAPLGMYLRQVFGQG